jgi:hypothetical protein
MENATKQRLLKALSDNKYNHLHESIRKRLSVFQDLGIENGGRAAVPLVQVVPTIENRAQQTELIELESPEAYKSHCANYGFDPEFAKITARFWFDFLPEWTEIYWAYTALEAIDNELTYLQWLCDKIRCVQPNNYNEQRQIKTWVQEVILRQFVPITELATDEGVI